MKQIHISKIEDVNNYWLVYRDDSDTVRHLDLSACANSYARRHPECPQAGHRIIGTRKLQGAMGVYELYDIGHSQILCPAKPGLWASLLAKLTGKTLSEDLWLEFEQTLNQNGYCTVETDE